MQLDGLIAYQDGGYIIRDRERGQVYVLQLGDVFEVMLCDQWHTVTFKSGGYRGRYIETSSGQCERLAVCMEARIDRASDGSPGSITSELYILSAGGFSKPPIGSVSASQAAVGSIPITVERGACSIGRYDWMSGQQTRQNAVVVRYRGILCLTDCYVWVRPISIGDGCAYARHTPRATWHAIPFRVWGGVPGGGCCAWFPMACLLIPTNTYVASGGGASFAAASVSVIGRTARGGHYTIRSEWRRVAGCCGWLPSTYGRLPSKPRPFKYMVACFLLVIASSDGYLSDKLYPSKCISGWFLLFLLCSLVVQPRCGNTLFFDGRLWA